MLVIGLVNWIIFFFYCVVKYDFWFIFWSYIDGRNLIGDIIKELGVGVLVWIDGKM